MLAGKPAAEAVGRLQGFATGGEGIEVVGNVAYLHTPNGFGRSKLGEKFDKGIGVVNAARNWNTFLKLMELVRKAAELPVLERGDPFEHVPERLLNAVKQHALGCKQHDDITVACFGRMP